MRTLLTAACRACSLALLIGAAGLRCADGPAEPTVTVPPAPRFYDARLDLADAEVEKAIALVRAASNPIALKPSKPFGGHDEKAIALMEKARSEIMLAIQYAIENSQQEP